MTDHTPRPILQGKKALVLVVTVIGTLLTARRFWRR